MRIGLFIAFVLLAVAVLIIIVGDVSSLFKKPGYPLYVQFDSVAGLEKSAMVRMAGVRIGTVENIRLHDMRARVNIKIDPEVRIRKKSKATLAALGLLGEKYIEIIPGEGKEFFQSGDTMEGISAVSLDQLGTLLVSIGSEVQEMGQAVKDMIGEGPGREDFQNTLSNLSVFTEDLKDFFARNREELDSGIKNSSRAVEKLDDKLEELSGNLDRLMGSVHQVVEENRENVKTNLENIKELISQIEKTLNLLNESLDKINRGEGTLGKLIHEKDLHGKAEEVFEKAGRLADPVSSFRMSPGFRMDFLTNHKKWKGFLGLEFWWGNNNFLQAQIIQDSEQDGFAYSLQGGYAWGLLRPRAGILESYFGVGIDVFLLEDKIRLSLDGYDFNREPRPRFRLTSRYNATRNVYLLLGLDDFTLAPEREIFFGLGWGM